MKEYQIGEVFEFDNLKLVVVEYDYCDQCVFNSFIYSNVCPQFRCGPVRRSDGKNVIAKELPKQ